MLKLLSVSKSCTQNGLGRATRRGFSMSRTTLREQVPRRVLLSVKPNELTSGDHFDISGKRQVTIRYRKAHCQCKHIIYQWEPSIPGQHHTLYPFPENTHGFFYYYHPENAPLFAGCIRFRICPSNDTRTFQDGQDLLTLNGLPWEISNWVFALNKTFRPWGEEMVENGVIRPGTLELCSKLASQAQLRQPPVHPILYCLKQPFLMPLGEMKVNFWIADEKNIMRIELTRSRILEPFNVALNLPRGTAPAHVCLDRDGDDFVIRLLSVPQEYAGEMKYKVGDTIPYRPRRPEVLDILKNFPQAAEHE
ncbi:hypothetical protein D9758_008019 [Tetrapyrgos nigripes]|uniref:Uncharacterized protein n=1 Tax=Tetrapyrgos nigripes TaxID=182062 RepID=A0A8H5D395_9AGAR|nr:hypothetical protein D9758_008019 [Tetrapyrgos nigripes]